MSDRAATRVAPSLMTSHPARALLEMASYGNPAAVPSISVHMCVRVLARA